MNPRQALKSLTTLARARDLELKELKRQAAVIADKMERVQHAIDDLHGAMAVEAVKAEQSPDMLAAYAGFAGQCRQRVAALEAGKESLAAELDLADARVLEGYRALKQVEEAADARRQEIRDEIERKERAEADDIAAVRAYARIGEAP